MTDASAAAEARDVLLRSSVQVILALVLAAVAWGLLLYASFVRPLPGVPVQMLWIAFVGCGVLLPIQVWNRSGVVSVVDLEAGPVLQMSTSIRGDGFLSGGARGQAGKVRQYPLAQLTSADGDDAAGLVKLVWRGDEAPSSGPVVGPPPTSLSCQQPAAFAAVLCQARDRALSASPRAS